MNNSVPSSNG